MKTRAVAVLLCVLAAGAAEAAAPSTMRVDYYHTGNAAEEHFSLDRVIVEPLPWPGNPAKPIDTTDRGKYFFEVVDAATGRTVFSRGFSSIYGEWETTGEAKVAMRTFSESLRFPLINRPARVVVKKRDVRNAFRDIWTLAIDPADKFIDRSGTTTGAGPIIKVHESGDPADKLDLLILGDGYTAAERSKFERDARRLTAVLFATSPFKERQHDINVWGLVPASPVSGVTRPSQHTYKHTPLGTTYDAFDTERYVLTFENRAFRDVAANAPYDAVEILVNSATYGGGGIYGLYSTVAAGSVWAPYVFVHEFGHHIAGLADEYYTSDVAYLPAAAETAATVETREDRGRKLARTAKIKKCGTRWVVPSQSKADAGSYMVDLIDGKCTCADYELRGAKCKHPRRQLRLVHSKSQRSVERSGRSKEPITRLADTSGPRPTASCLPGTRCRFARCAGARSNRCWIFIAAGRPPAPRRSAFCGPA